MADLLIKGMEMPQNCDKCNFAKQESEFHCICTAIHSDVCYVYPDKGKPDWCPLIEVPVHGRLIDENDFFSDDIIYPNKQFENGMRAFVLDMPTIIKASEEGE